MTQKFYVICNNNEKYIEQLCTFIKNFKKIYSENDLILITEKDVKTTLKNVIHIDKVFADTFLYDWANFTGDEDVSICVNLDYYPQSKINFSELSNYQPFVIRPEYEMQISTNSYFTISQAIKWFKKEYKNDFINLSKKLYVDSIKCKKLFKINDNLSDFNKITHTCEHYIAFLYIRNKLCNIPNPFVSISDTNFCRIKLKKTNNVFNLADDKEIKNLYENNILKIFFEYSIDDNIINIYKSVERDFITLFIPFLKERDINFNFNNDINDCKIESFEKLSEIYNIFKFYFNEEHVNKINQLIPKIGKNYMSEIVKVKL